MVSPKQLWRLLRETFAEWNDDNASRLAAALAYYTVFSLAPLLVIVVAIAGLFFGEQAAQGEIVGQIRGLVGQAGAEVIQTAVENANRPGNNSGIIATLISVALLIFGATGVFVQLQDALNTIWDVTAKPDEGMQGFVRKRILSFAMVVSIAFLLLVSLVVSAALTGFTARVSELFPYSEVILPIVNNVVSFGVIAFLFALVYRYVPDVKIGWSDVRFGAIITALLFVIGKYLIGLYLGNSSFSSTYGAAGSLVVFLAWIYYSAQVLFLGAEFTQVYAKRYGSRIVPDRHAMSLDSEVKPEQ